VQRREAVLLLILALDGKRPLPTIAAVTARGLVVDLAAVIDLAEVGAMDVLLGR
jgi:hypothetical protein